MKTTKHLFIQRILFFILLCATTSCVTNPYTSSIWKNENIDEEILNDVHYLNDYIMKAFRDNNIAEIDFLSKPFLDNTSKDDLANIFDQVHQIISYEEYKILDEYYVLNSSDSSTQSIPNDNYNFTYKSINKESYISIIELESSENITMIIGLVYGKFDDFWKLNICQIGHYKYYDKTAIDFYKIAENQFSKKHLINAMNNIAIATELTTTMNGMWESKQKNIINEASDNILNEAKQNYKMPIAIDVIETKPSIFSITHSLTEQGIVPIFHYKSSININDIVTLEKEYLEISKFAKRKFKGISDGNASVLFKAWKDIPKKDEEIDNHLFVHYY